MIFKDITVLGVLYYNNPLVVVVTDNYFNNRLNIDESNYYVAYSLEYDYIIDKFDIVAEIVNRDNINREEKSILNLFTNDEKAELFELFKNTILKTLSCYYYKNFTDVINFYKGIRKA